MSLAFKVYQNIFLHEGFKVLHNLLSEDIGFEMWDLQESQEMELITSCKGKDNVMMQLIKQRNVFIEMKCEIVDFLTDDDIVDFEFHYSSHQEHLFEKMRIEVTDNKVVLTMLPHYQ